MPSRPLLATLALGAALLAQPQERGAAAAESAAPRARKPTLERAREHWAFRELGVPAVPEVPAGPWAAQAIDRFVLARLAAEGLAPAPEADRAALLRRVTFDLTGLPPSPEEVHAFLADSAPDAWQRVVERLLASPHYGERMARWWLDLVRYADSNGLDENLALAHAWRYRDYVVRSFQRHKPYDRFLREQIAGDLLPVPTDREAAFDAWTATGMLVLGPKMLAEQDKQKLLLDVVDEQMDVLGRTVLGLTLGCARCHDHKFDPIPTRDYYALAGVFRSTATMGDLGFVSAWRERELGMPEEVAARHAHLERVKALEQRLAKDQDEAVAALRAGFTARAAEYLLVAEAARAAAILLEAEDATSTNLLADAKEYGGPAATVLRTHRPGLQSATYDLTVPRAGRLRLEVRYAAKDPRAVRVRWNGRVVAEAGLAATTGGWHPDALRWHTVAELDALPGRNVLELERERDFPHVDRLLFVALDGPAAAPGWPLPAAGGEDLAPGLVRRVVEWLHAAERAGTEWWLPWQTAARLPADAGGAALAAAFAPLRARARPGTLLAALLDGPTPVGRRELAARYQLLLQGAAARPEVQEALDPARGLFALDAEGLLALLPAATRDRLAAGRQELARLRAATPAPFPRALAVQDEAAADLAVHVRGSHLDAAGPPVPRGMPRLLDHALPRPAIPAGRSGRLELARWITDPANPLTARVLVNRVWRLHFGAGLVRTPSNFGLRGDPPTHPELLDWLAHEFVAGGWSIQDLQRAILASRAYRMDSRADGPARARDPENLLLWRQNRRRLEAEMYRDALLAVAGNLDRSMGGPALELENRAYVTNDQSQDVARYSSPRRTIYLPVIRNALHDLFTTFDYNDPSVHLEQRGATAIPSQALFVLNSPLVRTQSRVFAERLLALPALDEAGRLAALFLRAYGREPRAGEVGAAAAYLVGARAQHGEVRAWAALAQVVFASSEFLYLD